MSRNTTAYFVESAFYVSEPRPYFAEAVRSPASEPAERRGILAQIGEILDHIQAAVIALECLVRHSDLDLCNRHFLQVFSKSPQCIRVFFRRTPLECCNSTVVH